MSDDQHTVETTAHVVRCQATEELKRIRATLLVNFGEGAKHNRFGFSVKDTGRTERMFHEVLDRLVAQNDQLRQAMADVTQRLEAIVCTEGCDRGVILLSHEGPTHTEVVNGRPMQVYDHENFSPLGDALIELYERSRERSGQGGEHENASDHRPA